MLLFLYTNVQFNDICLTHRLTRRKRYFMQGRHNMTQQARFVVRLGHDSDLRKRNDFILAIVYLLPLSNRVDGIYETL